MRLHARLGVLCRSRTAHLAQQGELAKAGPLADARELGAGIVKDGERALLDDVEHVPCARMHASA